MIPNSRWGMPSAWNHFATTALAFALAILTVVPVAANAQAAGNGSVAGKIVDEHGAAVSSAQVFVDRTAIGALSRGDGTYILEDVPAGSHLIRVRLIGFRPDSATVSVSAGQRATQDFTLHADPLQLQSVVVTGTATPTVNLKSSVAVTTMTPEEIQQSAPRSTTEMLRYVPGFTRVESSGGEVNENISMRGILGVEYVMFMEDGLPVFPTMHTFFMNADNLFRPDENIRADGSRARRQLGAVRIQHTGRHHQLHQQDRRRPTARLDGRNRRHRGPRSLRPRPQRSVERQVAVQRRRLLSLRPRRARPRLPGHPGRTDQGQRHPPARQRLRAVLGQGHRRQQPVHPRPAVREQREPALRARLQRVRLDEHQRGPGPLGPDADGHAAISVRQRAADRRVVVHRRRRLRPREQLALPQQRADHARQSGVECARAVQRDVGAGLHHRTQGPGRSRAAGGVDHSTQLHESPGHRGQPAPVYYA